MRRGDPTRERLAPPSDGRPTLSILIATRDRADDLSNTLESLLTEENLTTDGWELLVVDNGSTDHTAQICAAFEEKFGGRMRTLVEPAPGKSKALNAGLRSVRGSVLAMTDDDVLCEPSYVRSAQELFSDPQIHSAQGRVFIDWVGGDPDRLDQLSVRLMSLRDFGEDLRPWNDNLTGCNMLVRTRAALEVGGFAEELGPGAAGFADDSEFSIRLRQAGFQAVYAPHPAVRHQVGAGRITRRALRDRFARLGRSYAYYKTSARPLWRQVLSMGREAVVGESAALLDRWRGRQSEALRRQCEISQGWGLVRERIRLRSVPKERRLTYMDGPSGQSPERRS